MGGWNPQVFPTTVGRGESLTVQIGASERFRNVRAELVLIERKLKSVLNETFNNERVVATAHAEPGHPSILLAVPAWVPDSYSGETVAWQYEVRVVGDQFGPDARHAAPVVVRGGISTDVEASGYTDAREGGPMRAVGALGRTASNTGEWVLALFVVGLALPPLYFGATVPHGFVLGFGLFLLALAVVIVIASFLQKPLAIDGVEIEVPDGVFRAGEPVEIMMRSDPDPTVEIGIEALEIFTRRNRNQVKVKERTTVVERYAPFTQQAIRIPTHPDDPGGYAGEDVTLTWTVAIRMVDTEPKDRYSRTRRFAIAKVA